MRGPKFAVPVVLLLATTLVSCNLLAQLQPPVAAGEARSNANRATVDTAAAMDAAQAMNDFGFDIYAALRAAGSGSNLVFSPASIGVALAMARPGARGVTADQMDAVMHSLGADAMANGIGSLDLLLNSRSGTVRGPDGDSRDVTLTLANATFAQRDEEWEQAYLDALAERFGAGVRLVDYKADFEAARGQINSWVSQQTNSRIPQLLGPGTLDTLTRLVLVNAIYLKAPWLVPFDAGSTTSADFTKADGSTVQAQMMSVFGDFAYAKGDGWQAVELPYIGNKLAMTLILPADFAAFAQSLDSAKFSDVVESLAAKEGTVALPRFNFETKTELAELLAGMGMTNAFDSGTADFSGMTTQEPLFIRRVVHQANISVDEKGTEAAAATAVVVSGDAGPIDPFNIRFDRPFIFALRDLETGAVVFLGQLTDPTAQ